MALTPSMLCFVHFCSGKRSLRASSTSSRLLSSLTMVRMKRRESSGSTVASSHLMLYCLAGFYIKDIYVVITVVTIDAEAKCFNTIFTKLNIVCLFHHILFNILVRLLYSKLVPRIQNQDSFLRSINNSINQFGKREVSKFFISSCIFNLLPLNIMLRESIMSSLSPF